MLFGYGTIKQLFPCPYSCNMVRFYRLNFYFLFLFSWTGGGYPSEDQKATAGSPQDIKHKQCRTSSFSSIAVAGCCQVNAIHALHTLLETSLWIFMSVFWLVGHYFLKSLESYTFMVLVMFITVIMNDIIMIATEQNFLKDCPLVYNSFLNSWFCHRTTDVTLKRRSPSAEGSNKKGNKWQT